MKILIAGDFHPAEGVKNKIENGDFQSVFGEVAPIVKAADYAIVNYESPVPAGYGWPIVKCGPNLSSSVHGPEAAKWAGFGMATLANNHIFDYGAEGLNQTMLAFKRIGMDTTGTGANLCEARKPFYKDIQGKKLAIVNCCEHEYSIAGHDTPGANPLNPAQQWYQIREARANADYVLVIVHGGHEHFQLPSPRMVETYRFFIDAGADTVVNHHQHCFSGYEVYHGKPIFYGLGNFCFASKGVKYDIWNEGYMVEITFQADNISFNLIPYIQCNEENKVIPIKEGSLSHKRFQAKIEKLNGIISDPCELQKEVDKFYEYAMRSCQCIFEPYEARLTRGLFHRHLLPSLVWRKWKAIRNYVECEAHRDKVMYMLKRKV